MALSNFLEDCLIYRDDDVLVIHKPVGILTINGKDIFDSVLTRLQQLEPRTLLIHRLDRDTSGLLVFALNKAAQSHISKQFQVRSTEKMYHALVEGQLEQDGQVDIPVCYDPNRPPLHIVDATHSKPALTHFKVLEQLELEGQPVTRVELIPVTGRSHQLRVHMQYLGHPIVGDTLYATTQGQTLMPRLCLHATTLSFIHPVTGKTVKFVCPSPF